MESDFPPLQALLPHRGPALLLDRLLGATPDEASCEVTLGEDFPYFQAGAVPSACALELLAQTAGVFAALERLRESHATEGAAGYLVGVPEARFLTPTLPLGVALTTRVVRRWREGGAAAFGGEVLVGARPLVSAELRVFEPAEVR